MAVLLKGALIEYGMDLIGPIPNVVIFQFNPEALNRTFMLPQRPTGAYDREQSQAGDSVSEKISLKAHFSALDRLGEDKVLAKAFGIGPQLAALEKMVVPQLYVEVRMAASSHSGQCGVWLVALAMRGRLVS